MRRPDGRDSDPGEKPDVFRMKHGLRRPLWVQFWFPCAVAAEFTVSGAYGE